MSDPFAASWRAIDQAQRLDTHWTRLLVAQQRAWRRECCVVTLLALSLVANVVFTWFLWR